MPTSSWPDVSAPDTPSSSSSCPVKVLTPSVDRPVVALSYHNYDNPAEYHVVSSTKEPTVSYVFSGLDHHDLDPPNTPEHSCGNEVSSRTQQRQHVYPSPDSKFLVAITRLLSLGKESAFRQPTVLEQSPAQADGQLLKLQTITTNCQMAAGRKASSVTQQSDGGAVLTQETVGEEHVNEGPAGGGDQAIDDLANCEAQASATIATRN
ncbi:hypothetical protein F5882DRAFT_473819, partial [Hyaloscypha sp. PMI_1271]